MVTIVPNVTNWSVTPQNGQVGYFTLMNTWLFESTSVIASLNTAITKINEAGNDINNIGTNAINAITLDTVDDLATYTGTGLVIVKDLNRGGTFIYDATQSAVNNGGTVFDGWVRQFSGDIYIEWFESDTENDITNVLKDAIAIAQHDGKKIVGNSDEIYTISETIDIVGMENITLDFRGASIIDNVQTIWTSSANRGGALFNVYNSSNIEILNFNYSCADTRYILDDDTIPTTVIWVGGQFQGSEETSKVLVKNINFRNPKESMMPVGLVGELKNVKVENIDVFGDWKYGINIEYGLRPSDPSITTEYKNGRHAYNVTVNNFNGFDIPNCNGFLRVASTYNVEFNNCVGSNVKNFIYVYGGDRNISRFSENVTFNNCKHHSGGEAELSAGNYVVSILFVDKDGSTGEVLPDWTNYNHSITFNNCEFQNNDVTGSTCVRHYGNQGKTTFNNSIFRDSYYGVRTGPSSNPSYRSTSTLSFYNCQFISNKRDALVEYENRVLFYRTKFLKSIGTMIPISISSSVNTEFSKCEFSGLVNSNYWIENNGTYTKFYDNTFTLNGSKAILQLSLAFGKGNHPNTEDTLCDMPTYSTYRMIKGEECTYRTSDIVAFGTSLDANKTLVYTTLSTSQTINSITGGIIGDVCIMYANSISSNITLIHLLSSIATSDRLRLKNKVDKTLNDGTYWIIQFKKTSSGWIEI